MDTSAIGVLEPSAGFARLRQVLINEPRLREELEWYLGTVVENFNPSSRSNRFISGALVEWGVALCGWHAGVFMLPEGHDANEHDLASLRSAASELWSIKSSNSEGAGYRFIISNTRGGHQPKGLTRPTLFLHPSLPGIVFVDPDVHGEVAASISYDRDASTLQLDALQDHSVRHPECVAVLQMPRNPGAAVIDPAFDIVREYVKAAHFRRLGEPFRIAAAEAAQDPLSQVLRVQERVKSGELTKELGDRLIEKIVGDSS